MLVFLVGCVPEPVYAVRRSALVPHPAPPMRTGRAPDHEVRASFYSSTDVVAATPQANPGANAGLYVARHNLGGSLEVRVLPHTYAAATAQVSFREGEMAVASDAAMPPDGGNANGIGFEIGHALVLSDQVQLAIVAGMMEFDVPYYEQAHCIANCNGVALDYMESGTHGVEIWSFSLLPSYREGSLTLFSGLTLRNHPTNTKADDQTAAGLGYDSQQEIRGGPLTVILGAGVEWAATDYIKLMALAYQPVISEVVSYGPAVAIAASLDLPVR